MKTHWLGLIICILVVWSCSKESDLPPEDPGGGGVSRAVTVIKDDFKGEPIVLAGSKNNEFMVAFKRTLPGGTELNFEALSGALPKIMTDQEGNEWDIFGVAVSGPRVGARLEPIKSYIGFWFAWGTMFPGLALHDGPSDPGSFQQPDPAEEWLIPLNTVFSGVGFDGIPSVDAPQFRTYQQRDLLAQDFRLEDEDLLVGIRIGNTIRLYPHAILNWHEIVNDEIDGIPFALTFCPLTGTAMAFSREISTGVTTFGVSGLLYNSNVIPYDRATESFWSQMREDCVHGDLIGEQLEWMPVVETNWKTWKRILPNPTVLTRETGIGKDYDSDPYEGYAENHDLLSFPIEYDDPRLPRKERVLGVIVDGEAKAYQFSDF